jgi:hypothetical protein
MTHHRIEFFCNVNNTESSNLELSSKQPNATFIKLVGQQTLIVSHIVVSMNLNKSRHVLKNQKNGQIIKTLTLKRKVKQ